LSSDIDPEQLLKQANSLYRAGRFRDARETIEQADEKEFEDPDFATLRGKIMFRLQMLDEARKDLKKGIRAGSASFGTLYYLARVHMEKENTLEALRTFKHALRETRDTKRIAIINSNLALVNFLLKRVNTATDFLEEAIRAEKVPGAVLANIGFIFLQKLDFKNAQRFLTQSLRADPNLAQARFFLANLFFVRGKLDLAETEITNALQLRPEWIASINFRANILKARHKFEEAAAGYGLSLSISPEQTNADFCLLSLGDCAYRLDDIEGALEYYRRLVKEHPKSDLKKTAQAYVDAL